MEIETMGQQALPQQQPQQQQMMNQKKNATLNEYIIIETLGKGFSAKVKLGFHTQNNIYAALKIMTNQNMIQNSKTTKNEVEMMQKLSHPNIVNLYEVQSGGTYTKKNGQQKKVMFISMELARGGELFEYVAQTGTFSDVVARSYFHQLMSALEYCHNQGICHRDLKPENLLFDDFFNLKVCDFGFSTFVCGRDGSGYLSTVLGTESYMCPQIHEKQPYKGEEADLFASAIVLFIMYAGTPPFTKATNRDPYYKLIFTNKIDTFWAAHARYKQKGYYSDTFKDFMSRMFQYNPANRMNMQQIKQHPWFQGQVMTSEQMNAEFSQRKKKVENELEHEKLKKQQEKLKKASQENVQQGQAYVYVAHQGFRSGDTLSEFEGLDSTYPTLNLKRELKQKDNKNKKVNDFFTSTEIDYLWKYVVLMCQQQFDNKEAQNQGQNVVLNEKNYKILCKQAPKDELSSEVQIEVKITQLDEDINCVEFLKVTGDSLDFYNILRTLNENLSKLKAK